MRLPTLRRWESVFLASSPFPPSAFICVDAIPFRICRTRLCFFSWMTVKSRSRFPLPGRDRHPPGRTFFSFGTANNPFAAPLPYLLFGAPLWASHFDPSIRLLRRQKKIPTHIHHTYTKDTAMIRKNKRRHNTHGDDSDKEKKGAAKERRESKPEHESIAWAQGLLSHFFIIGVDWSNIKRVAIFLPLDFAIYFI